MTKAPAPSTGLIRRVLRGLAGCAVLALLAGGGWQLYRLVLAQPFRHVVFAGEVDRLPHRDLDALTLAIQAHPEGLPLAAVREAARRVPWVRDAGVRRRWPDTVEITFHAHRAFARWNEDRLVSDAGEVFEAPDAGALPKLAGPEGSAPAMVAQFPALARALEPLGSPLATLNLSARGAWQAVLASGQVLELGRVDVLARAGRFAEAWPRLAQQGYSAPHVDLRYANGFALKRATTTPANAPK